MINICSKKKAVEFVYRLMDPKKETTFLNHIKDCPKCASYLTEVSTLKKVIKSELKSTDKIPSFNSIKFPETLLPQKSYKLAIDWPEIFSAIPGIKILRYTTALLGIIAIILCVKTLFNKKNITKCIQITKIEEKVTGNPIQKQSKEINWCFPTGGPLRSQPLLKDGILYFGSEDMRVYSLNSETGKLLWEYKTGGVISSAPLVKGEFIYIASADENLYKLNSKTGKLIWQKEVGTLVMSQIFINESRIYIANNDGNVISIDRNGKEIWQKNLNVKIYSPINGDENSIYFGSEDGTVYSLLKKDGSLNWSYTTGSHFLSCKPAIIDDQVLIGNSAGIFYSFNKLNGKIDWQYKTGYQIVSDTLFYNNRIYFASDKLYCLNTTGNLIWKYTPSAPIDINFNIDKNVITAIDKNNNIYSIHTKSGICLKKETPQDFIYSYVCAQNKIFAGNQKGELCLVK